MEISIVVPAYNEEAEVGHSLAELLEFCEKNFARWEIIVVDDGSTDATGAVARGVPAVSTLRNEVNRGKGYSVKRGVLAARYDPILFTDVDLSAPIGEARDLMRALRDGADLAVGVRTGGSGKKVSRTRKRRLKAWAFSFLVRAVLLPGLADTQCGFKLFRRAAARRLFSLQRVHGWAFDVEILFLARRLGFRIAQVPVAWHEGATTRLRWYSPFSMVWEVLRIRWLHRGLVPRGGRAGVETGRTEGPGPR